MDEFYFFDSYALIEQLKGNTSYEPYKRANIFTSKLNIFEVEYCYLKHSSDVEELITTCNLMDFDIKIVRFAVQFKRANKKLSLVDCVGYSLALTHGMKFLTGDKEFKGLPNVEFVH